MAFTTTTGSGGTSLIGTSGIDTTTIAAPLTGAVFIGAQGDADIVNLGAALGAVASYTAQLGAGNDIFTSAAAVSNSTIKGDEGNDAITLASLTSSTVSGLNGIDTITFATANTAVSSSLVNGNEGNDIFAIGGGQAVAVNGSTIAGGSGDDAITINTTTNINGSKINGQNGDDTITVTNAGANMTNATVFGGQGNDAITSATGVNVILSGDIGNDVITSAGGNDTVFGGEGADTISTGAGFDSMSGGNGVDTFNSTVAATGAGTVQNANQISAGDTIGAANTIQFDIITDFTAGVGQDRIDLDATLVYSNSAINVAAGLVANRNYVVSGTYNSSGTFTVASSNTSGPDSIVFTTANANYTGITQAYVLRGVNASLFVQSQIV